MASRTAIVTGAGTGIGKAVASALLQAGWNTVFCGRRQAVLDTSEIKDERTDRMLPTEFEVGQASAAQSGPKTALRVG